MTVFMWCVIILMAFRAGFCVWSANFKCELTLAKVNYLIQALIYTIIAIGLYLQW